MPNSCNCPKYFFAALELFIFKSNKFLGLIYDYIIDIFYCNCQLNLNFDRYRNNCQIIPFLNFIIMVIFSSSNGK